MLRLRFASGLILGLVLGLSGGTLIGVLIVPSHGDPNVSTTLQIQELTRKLEAAKDSKERVDRQLDQFAKLADQMSASFNTLEQRFKALEEEQRLRDTRRDQPAVAAARPPTATAAPSPTQAPAATAGNDAPVTPAEAGAQPAATPALE